MKNLTVFLVIGMLLLATGIPYSILLINGNSAQDGLMGIYLLFAIPSVLLVLLLDRFFIRKFGCNKVNQVQLYFFWNDCFTLGDKIHCRFVLTINLTDPNL